MTPSLIRITALALLLSACGGSGSNDPLQQAPEQSGQEQEEQLSSGLPSTPFTPLADYALTDFFGDSAPLHLEIRRSPVQGPMTEPEEYELLYIYSHTDPGLTEAQQEQLTAIDSDVGFFNLCQPMNCAAYGVVLTETGAQVLSSTTELMAFLDSLNNPAKLHLWLYANAYQAISYAEVEGGYRAVAAWDDLCGERGEDLLFIDYNGIITLLENVSTEETLYCA